MDVINWLISNWPALISILALLLSAAAMMAHLAHADSVASQIQNIEGIISQLGKVQNPPSSPLPQPPQS